MTLRTPLARRRGGNELAIHGGKPCARPVSGRMSPGSARAAYDDHATLEAIAIAAGREANEFLPARGVSSGTLGCHRCVREHKLVHVGEAIAM
jgi:hypothetical protein